MAVTFHPEFIKSRMAMADYFSKNRTPELTQRFEEAIDVTLAQVEQFPEHCAVDERFRQDDIRTKKVDVFGLIAYRIVGEDIEVLEMIGKGRDFGRKSY